MHLGKVQLDELTMDRSQRMRIDWALTHTGTWIDPTATDQPSAACPAPYG
jgi:hypothetical protein